MAVLARGLIIDDYKKGASNLILCITKNQVQNVRRRRILAGNVALIEAVNFYRCTKNLKEKVFIRPLQVQSMISMRSR